MKGQIIFLLGAIAGAVFGGEIVAVFGAFLCVEFLLYCYALSIAQEKHDIGRALSCYSEPTKESEK